MSGSHVVRFRPTLRQATGRALRGGLVTMTVAVVPMTTMALRGHWAWPHLVVLPVSLLVGFLLVLPMARAGGVEADTTGIHLRSWRARDRHCAPWHLVTEIRAEHRYGRTVPVVYWGQGRVWRLTVPFDGAALGADPRFDEKLCTLRDMWKTHRRNRLHDDRPALL